MALELRPKQPKPGQVQKWVARFQIPTGKRNKAGKLIYKNHSHVLGERGKMTKRQAEEEYDNYKRRVKRKGSFQSPGLEEFAYQFLKQKREVDKIRSTERYRQSLRHLIEFFGPLTELKDITVRNIDEYKSIRLDSVKPGTVNRELQCLKALINLADKWNVFSGDNPVSKAGLLREIREEAIPVSHEEENKLIPALQKNVSRICEFALNTGMRIEEILQLKEKALKYDKQAGRTMAKIEATEQKGKRIREVPLNDRAMTLIKEAKDYKKEIGSKSSEIFVNQAGVRYAGHDSIYPIVVRTCKKLHLRKIYPHLFRHTFITRLLENGADPITVREIVGHADLKTLLRYTHLRSSKYNAVDLLN